MNNFRKNLSLAWIICAFVNPLLALSAPPEGQRWIPIPELTDEFNTHDFDHSKWNDSNPQWKGRAPGFFSSTNVMQTDGLLELSARKEALPEALQPYHNYSTSAVKSKHKVMYGYFEIRAKPMKAGVSSAFWFYDAQPEQWTEIDVFELGAGIPEHERAYHMNAHVFHTEAYKGSVADHIKYPATWTAPWPLADDYHLYGLEWDEKKIKWYVDGKVLRTLDNIYWHYPLYMNFDSEIMLDWFGLPMDNQLPATYKIDYVRSWKRND